MEKIEELLKQIIHPETGKDIVSMGMLESVNSDDPTKVVVTIQLTKPRDPMASSIRRAIEGLILDQLGVESTVIVKESAKSANKQKVDHKSNSTTNNIHHIIAIASGKGGVGKSTVTANLAVALARAGKRVGVIDADIYGPSMPKMFGVESYIPMSVEGNDHQILPAQSHGIKIQSIGFFVSQTDALIWRGPMATNALKQLLHQTLWGELDYLLIDLPPGTGDLHLTVVGELKIDSAIIVTTPAAVALADVVRGISMFRNEHVSIPVLGVVSNMAYFTPAELPENKYYIFGPQGNIERVASDLGIEVLSEIPLVQSVAAGGDSGRPIASQNTIIAKEFDNLAQKLISKF